MKGFKDKSGKFRPTERYTKNSLKKKDLYKKSLSSPSGNRHEMREKKTLYNDIDIDTHNFGLDVTDGEIVQIRLGNWTDAGWHWSLSGDDAKEHANTFLIRIANDEDEAKEFVELAKKQGLDFDIFKKQILKNLTGELKDDDKSDDGIYVITGDSGNWKFGEDQNDAWEGIVDSYFDGSVDYTDDEQAMVLERAWDIDKAYSYETFLGDYGRSIREDMIDNVKNSDSFEEYFEIYDHDNSLNMVSDQLREGMDNHLFDTIGNARDELQKEGKLRKEAGQTFD